MGDADGSDAREYVREARGLEGWGTFLGSLGIVVLAVAAFYVWGYIESAPLRARHTGCPWFGGPLPRHIGVVLLLTSVGAGLGFFIMHRETLRLRALIPLCVFAFLLVGLIDFVAMFGLGGGGECYD